MLSRITEAVTPMTHHPSPIFDTGCPLVASSKL